MPLASIRPSHVSGWASAHPLGASAVSRDLAILHAIFDSAEREELIDQNPAKRVERPRQPRNRWRLLELPRFRPSPRASRTTGHGGCS